MKNEKPARIFVASSDIEWEDAAYPNTRGVRLLKLPHGYEIRFPETHKIKADLIFPERNAFGFSQTSLSDPEHYRKIACGCDLVIAASTPIAEQFVYGLKGSGTIVARYSRFYNGTSRYTRRSAATGGYSLDIPKDQRYFNAFLRRKEALEAIVSRDEKRIGQGIWLPNDELEWSILTTPYLKQALKQTGRKTK